MKKGSSHKYESKLLISKGQEQRWNRWKPLFEIKEEMKKHPELTYEDVLNFIKNN